MVVVQVPCNSCRVDCILAPCTNQDIISWIKREKIHYMILTIQKLTIQAVKKEEDALASLSLA
jgi:hypothetical protein